MNILSINNVPQDQQAAFRARGFKKVKGLKPDWVANMSQMQGNVLALKIKETEHEIEQKKYLLSRLKEALKSKDPKEVDLENFYRAEISAAKRKLEEFNEYCQSLLKLPGGLDWYIQERRAEGSYHLEISRLEKKLEEVLAAKAKV